MKRTVLALGIALMALTLTACDVFAGGACSPIGSQHTNKDGTSFTCVKNQDTGKGYWYKGKP